MMDMVNITPFSIKVASVIGSFIAVPKHAQSIWDFCFKARNTPKVLIDKISMVNKITINKCHSSKKAIPKTVSRKGYNLAYAGIFFAKGS